MPARRVLKHVIPPWRDLELLLPEGSQIIAAGCQVGPNVQSRDGVDHCVWVEQANAAPSLRVLIHVVMTGDYVQPDWGHLGSWIGVDAVERPYAAHFYAEWPRG